jgi:hypothetical protein
MRDRHFFILVTVCACVVAMLPWMIGRVLTPTGAQFYGNSTLAAADPSIYYSYMLQGRAGHLFMYDAFTSEAHQATLIQPVWFLGGQLSRLLGTTIPDTYALMRLLTTPILVWVLWWTVRWMWPDDRRKQRIGLLLTIIASGFGALVMMIGPTSRFMWPDMWVSEAYTILTLWASPHFILVTAGILFVLVSIERSWLERSWKKTVVAGVVALAVLSVHPFHVVTWLVVAVLLTLWRWIIQRRFPWRYVGYWAVLLVLASPVLLLYGFQLIADPLTIGRAIQNHNESLLPFQVMVGLGIPFCVALWALCVRIWHWQPNTDGSRWALALAGAYGIATYLPLMFQRRLGQGMMIAVVLLATPWIVEFWERLRQRAQVTSVVVGVIVVTLLSLSWLETLSHMTLAYQEDLRRSSALYYLSPDVQRLASVLRQTDPHQPVLSSIIEGNVLGGLSAHQMYIGYSVETLQFDRKQQLLKEFFGSMTQTQQRQLLANAGLCYVLDSPWSRSYGQAFRPSEWGDLIIRWQGVDTVLYETPYCRR